MSRLFRARVGDGWIGLNIDMGRGAIGPPRITGPLGDPHPVEVCYRSRLHCHVHDRDEAAVGFRYCLECGHMFATAAELVAAHNEVLAALNKAVDPAGDRVGPDRADADGHRPGPGPLLPPLRPRLVRKEPAMMPLTWVYYCTRNADGTIHVTNTCGPKLGQHHVHDPDGFTAWQNASPAIPASSIEWLTGTTDCDCGQGPQSAP